MSPATPPVTYLDSATAAAAWLDGLGAVTQLAIDTEGASFHKFIDRIYLIQLSTRSQHAIIDPLPIGSPATLGRLLEDPKVEVVFHDADYDLRLLHQDYGWHVRRIFDTRIAAQLIGAKAFGLAALLEQHFGVKLDKKHQRADWSMRPLTQGMLDYAAQDTLHLLGLRDLMYDALERMGRRAWAEEEFQRLEGTRWPAEDPATAFMKIKGARDLTRRELAVLREVAQWRDARAREVDRSTFRVLANEVMFDIARTQPRAVDALMKLKGMPRSLNDRHARELIDGVARAMALPENELPKYPKAPRWDKDPDFDHKFGALKSVRDDAAARLQLDPGFFCSRERMESVARLLPRSVDELTQIPELRRWQIETLGADFVAALAPFARRAAKTTPDSPYAD
ncbi:MAG: HRDC domain-containing protein [Gemmatimonadaceae bacterium]|nr:HRDC domain-containing protein [Gemmatimonadaceae bacterium]